MKKLFLLVVVLLTACSHVITKQQIAQRLVKDYLHNDPDKGTAYKADGFDNLATLYQVLRPVANRRDTVTIYTINTGDKSAPDSTVVGYKIAAAYSFRDGFGKHSVNSFFWIDRAMTKVIRVDPIKR